MLKILLIQSRFWWYLLQIDSPKARVRFSYVLPPSVHLHPHSLIISRGEHYANPNAKQECSRNTSLSVSLTESTHIWFSPEADSPNSSCPRHAEYME